VGLDFVLLGADILGLLLLGHFDGDLTELVLQLK
jgi:hypothetical protein